jgi:F-type H+-transporting ATPase subunit gamma
METAESLKRSITVTEELQSVVKTMKALAGVNIRQYERAAHAVADYNRTIEMGLQIALQRLPLHALPPKHPPAGVQLGAIVFGSDQGMCGQLNDQVVSHASRALEKLAVRRESQALLAVGVRAASQLESLGRTLDGSVQVPSSTAGITAAVEEVLRRIEEWHFQRGIEFVVLFNARPVSGAWYRVRGVRLLPVDREWINSLRAKPWPSKVLPMFTMDETQLPRRRRIAGKRKRQPPDLHASGRAQHRGSPSGPDHRVPPVPPDVDHVRTAGHHSIVRSAARQAAILKDQR